MVKRIGSLPIRFTFTRASMKLFLDTAHLPTIKKGLETGLIEGITTNPTLLSKEGDAITDLLKEICSTMEPYDVSVEVTQRDPKALYAQARRIADLASNVVVKVPCLPEYTPLIKQLVQEGIAVNITLIFSAVQGLLMAKLGVKYISPFVGRLDDIDINGIDLVRDLKKIQDTYGFKTQLLAASLRSPLHVHDAALAGADVATLPPTLFDLL
ncbi:fructose-6-phosphate aldolase, partial [Candidatus Dependentiae bacterium]|nr:fructose-6-phosphate aldolase [Candidatus Dependentiae bacterium]